MLLWWVLGLSLLIGSVQTVAHAHAAAGAHGPHVAILGIFEAAAALLFLVPRTLRIGAFGLLASLAVAFAVHAFMKQLRWDLLVYAAAVFFVAAHGPAPTPLTLHRRDVLS